MISNPVMFCCYYCDMLQWFYSIVNIDNCHRKSSQVMLIPDTRIQVCSSNRQQQQIFHSHIDLRNMHSSKTKNLECFPDSKCHYNWYTGHWNRKECKLTHKKLMTLSVMSSCSSSYNTYIIKHNTYLLKKTKHICPLYSQTYLHSTYHTCHSN